MGKLWLLLVSLTASYGSLAERPSALMKLHPGEIPAPNSPIGKRKPVFIYYLADHRSSFSSVYQNHLQRVLDALLEKDSELSADQQKFLLRLRKFILADLEYDRVIGEIEIGELRKELCLGSGRFPYNVMIFQNSVNPVILEEKGYDGYSGWELCRQESPQDGTFRKAWKIENVANLSREPQWEDQYLTHPATFRAALAEIRKAFPPLEYRYLMMIRGRGDANYLLKAQYAFDTTALDPTKLRRTFIARWNDFGAAPEFELDSKYTPIVHEILGQLFPPLDRKAAGLRKWEALELLAEMGGGDIEKGAYFSRVYWNTTGAPLELADDLKRYASAQDYTGLNIKNVAGFRHFGVEGAIPKIPLEKLGDFFGPEPTFEERLETLLERWPKKGGNP